MCWEIVFFILVLFIIIYKSKSIIFNVINFKIVNYKIIFKYLNYGFYLINFFGKQFFNICWVKNVQRDLGGFKDVMYIYFIIEFLLDFV